VVKADDLEMLQDLIAAAVNEAGRKVNDTMKSGMGGMLSGLTSGIVTLLQWRLRFDWSF